MGEPTGGGEQVSSRIDTNEILINPLVEDVWELH